MIYAFSGSRRLCFSELLSVTRVASSVVSAGHSLIVGCAVGTDEAVISSCPRASVSVVSAFCADGRGSFSGSAVREVLRHSAEGGAVEFVQPSGLSVPLSSRLHSRTVSVVERAEGLVAFLPSDGGESRGTCLAIRSAISRGIPVYVFGSCPVFGKWERVQGGLFSGAFRYISEQTFLF